MHLWSGWGFDGKTRTVDSHNKRITQKERKALITTVKRCGYKFELVE
jgi:DNA-binding response OmpR family regulator